MPIPTTPLKEPKRSAKARVYETLLDWIADGTLQPGERLSDIEIANYFSFSRTPVREALQLLADQRLVDIFPGRESRVAPIDFGQAASNYFLMGRLNAVALELCRDRLEEEHLNRLEELNRGMWEALRREDYRAVRQGDREFHFLFFTLADNYFLLSAAQNLYTHCIRIENLYFSQGNDFSQSLELHDRIIAALREGDMEGAGELLTRNWTDTVERLEELTGGEGAPTPHTNT